MLVLIAAFPLSGVVLAVIAVSCATLSTPTPARASVLPIEVQEYAHDFSVPQATTEERLALQEKAVAIVGQHKAILGNEYASVWFDNQNAEYVILTLSDANQTAWGGFLDALMPMYVAGPIS